MKLQKKEKQHSTRPFQLVGIRICIIITLLALTLTKIRGQVGDIDEFVALPYNNPSLVVDLGVGLWAWPLPMDFDLDGDMDLLVSCPDVPFNGTYLFENEQGEGVIRPIFSKPERLADGMKNLQLSIVNQQMYVLGPGIEYQNFRERLFSDPKKILDKKIIESQHEKIRFSQWKFADYENDGDLDLIVGIDDWIDYGWDNAFDTQGNWINGPLHGNVYCIEKFDGTYHIPSKILAGSEPIDVYGAPTPNLADFDGDGDLDIICGEFLDRLSWFENVGTRQKPRYAPGRFLATRDGIIQMDLEMIIPVSVDWDGDGDVDLVVGDEDGRVALVENTSEIWDGMPVFKQPTYFEQKAENVKFGALVTPYAVDWDQDGDEDLICGNTAGYIGFIENLGGGSSPVWAKPQRLTNNGDAIRIMAGDQGSIQGPAEKKWGYTTLSVADWDGDGLADIVVNSIWGKIEWIKNVGSKGHPKLADPKPVQVAWADSIPKPAWNWWRPSKNELATQWRTTPQAIDWNQDGYVDLVMLDPEGFLSFYERFKEGDKLLLKPGARIFHCNNASAFDGRNTVLDKEPGLLRLNADEYGKSGRRKFCFSDWDQDGDLDLIVNSTNAAWFENVEEKSEKVVFNFRGDLSAQKLAGHTTSPTVVDWNNDGSPDLLLGAEDGFLYFLLNSYSK
ncbi:MAG: VCBS repeat-containing protein [Saprospiraceae bacterium]|nr:VCBS repeat-containing protein [Saprospiraceae bacterium]